MTPQSPPSFAAPATGERIRGLMRRAGRRLLDVAFPERCLLCGSLQTPVSGLCPACRESLPAAPENFCLRCGGETARPEEGCGQCPAHGDGLDAFHCPLPFQGPARALIHGLKYRDNTAWGERLAALCWERLGPALDWERPDAVVPVPLHPWRLIRRRYNQAALLGQGVARRLGVPLDADLLLRIRRTDQQVGMSAARRRANVQGAFRAKADRAAGRSLLLVDDVRTTGATLEAACQALKAAGAARVVALCLARAGSDDGPQARPGELHRSGGSSSGTPSGRNNQRNS